MDLGQESVKGRLFLPYLPSTRNMPPIIGMRIKAYLGTEKCFSVTLKEKRGAA